MPRIGFTWSFPATIHKAQQIFKGHSGNYLLKSDSRADSILAATDLILQFTIVHETNLCALLPNMHHKLDVINMFLWAAL